MMFSPFEGLHSSEVLSVCHKVASVGVLLCALERLATIGDFSEKGVFAGSILEHRYNHWFRPLRFVLGSAFHVGRLWPLAYLIELCACIAIWTCSIESTVYVAAIFAIALVRLSEISRVCGVGLDGADQMTNVIFVSTAISFAILQVSQMSSAIVLVFICSQVSLSYFAAGVAKLISPQWRSEIALSRVLRNFTYGVPSFSEWLVGMPLLLRCLSWTVLVWEVGFAALFLGPPQLMVTVLFVGVAFHLFCAIVMGLNSFFWAFTATYPAVFFCYQALHDRH